MFGGKRMPSVGYAIFAGALTSVQSGTFRSGKSDPVPTLYVDFTEVGEVDSSTTSPKFVSGSVMSLPLTSEPVSGFNSTGDGPVTLPAPQETATTPPTNPPT